MTGSVDRGDVSRAFDGGISFKLVTGNVIASLGLVRGSLNWRGLGNLPFKAITGNAGWSGRLAVFGVKLEAMNILKWIQFSIGAFSAILQEIMALKAAGVPTNVAAGAMVAQAHAAPGITDEHKAIITAAGVAAQTVADSIN